MYLACKSKEKINKRRTITFFTGSPKQKNLFKQYMKTENRAINEAKLLAFSYSYRFKNIASLLDMTQGTKYDASELRKL